MIKKVRARLNLRRHLRRIDDWLIAYIPQKKQYSNAVLIIRLDSIGDFILWLDSAKEFRRIYLDKKIVLCANASWASLAERLTYWDEVISKMERKGYQKFNLNLIAYITLGFSFHLSL